MAFLMSFQMVFFAYELLEFVGVTVSETKNPREVLPKAVNEIIVRVLIFYVGRARGHHVHRAVDLVQAERGRLLCLPRSLWCSSTPG